MKTPLVTHSITVKTHGYNGVLSHIKWCRENLGIRGSDWDFHGGYSIVIQVYNQKAATFYIMTFPDSKAK